MSKPTKVLLLVTMPLWWLPAMCCCAVAGLTVFLVAGVVKEGYEMLGEKPPQWSKDYSRTNV